jgi:hypothetical protein
MFTEQPENAFAAGGGPNLGVILWVVVARPSWPFPR